MNAPLKDTRPIEQVVQNELSTRSGSHTRFAERICLSLLSAPPRSAAQRSLAAISAALSAPQTIPPRDHYTDLSSAFSALPDSERVIIRAFNDRCLRVLSEARRPVHVHRNHIWGLVACGTLDSVASLFRVLNGVEFDLAPAALRDAAIALSSHRRPESMPLVLKSINHRRHGSLSQQQREALATGLAKGTVVRLALNVSEAATTGTAPVNSFAPSRRFHHHALLRELIQQNVSPSLRHHAIGEIGNITDPAFLWHHPLVSATAPHHTPLSIPPHLMEIVREAVNHPEPRAQREAVRSLRRSYRGGDGPEGELVRAILAGEVGGPTAREEVEVFLKHFPLRHVQELYRATHTQNRRA